MNGEEQLVVAAEGLASEADTLKTTIAQVVVESFSLTAHEVVIVPQGTLPRTSSGKPQRRKSKDLYLNGTLPRARSVQDQTSPAGDAGVGA